MNARKDVMTTRTTLAVALLASSFLATGAEEYSDYSVAQLLEPCVEGDNDSRWGAAAEAECEQYIRGFTDAFLLKGGDDQVCLPQTGNRADEIRWAFMKWAHKNYSDRHQPAAEGLMKAMRSEFPCKE